MYVLRAFALTPGAIIIDANVAAAKDAVAGMLGVVAKG
jgi:hypothetical protein